MLRREPVLGQQHSPAAGPAQPRRQLPVAVKGPDLVAAAVQVQQHPPGVGAGKRDPARRDPVGVGLADHRVARQRIQIASAVEASPVLRHGRRRLARRRRVRCRTAMPTHPAVPASIPPQPARTGTVRAPSTVSRPPATAIASDVAPNSSPEYNAKTRPATASGARWLRTLRVATVSAPLARPPKP